ncbi:HlyD family secretion protein [Bacteroidota bacterium]
MRHYKYLIIFLTLTTISISCSSDNDKPDAYGNFEALETFVSAEANGRILELNIVEGQDLEAGDTVGFIDASGLNLQLEQLIAKKAAVSANVSNVNAQIELQKEQKRIFLIEKTRVENMLESGAATAKNLDDLNGKISLIEKQITSIRTQYNKISKELITIDKQADIIKDQISRCIIKSPIKGSVLQKYSMAHEMTVMGKTLFKISDLSYLNLRAYITGNQLGIVKLGQEVKVMTDNIDGLIETTGEIIWISPKAEFTPKIIQTKEERVNLVYAMKIRVKNDGSLKIGMPGEVRF